MISIKEHFAKKRALKSRRTQKRLDNASLAKLANQTPPRAKLGHFRPIPEIGWQFWRDKADKMWSEAVKMTSKRSGNTICRRCGIRPGTTACHIIPRGKYATRFLLRNGYLGCGHCNLGEMMNRLDYRQHHIEMIGAAAYEELVYVSNNGQSKFSRVEMREIYEFLKSVVEGGKNGSRRSGSAISRKKEGI